MKEDETGISYHVPLTISETDQGMNSSVVYPRIGTCKRRYYGGGTDELCWSTDEDGVKRGGT